MEEINIVENIIRANNEYIYQNPFFWIYPFTNENINKYYDYFNFNNKSVLTVTSSGDHSLNAILLGAKKVDTFDINPLAKFYFELKIAGIKSLSYEEFLEFFSTTTLNNKSNKKCFDNKIYFNKMSKHLNPQYKDFWDYIFNKYNGNMFRKTILFSKDNPNIETILKINKYLNKQNYLILKHNINNVQIRHKDINLRNLTEVRDKYNIVLLSNIACYLNDIYDYNGLKEFKTIIEHLKKDNNTEIVLSYLYYSFFDYLIGYDDIYNNDKVKEFFNPKEYEYKWFESTTYVDNKSPLKKIFLRNDGILKTK